MPSVPLLFIIESRWIELKRKTSDLLKSCANLRKDHTSKSIPTIKQHYRILKSAQNDVFESYSQYCESLDRAGACKEKKDLDDENELLNSKINYELIALKDAYCKLNDSSNYSLKTCSTGKSKTEIRKTELKTKMLIEETKKNALEKITEIDDKISKIENEKQKLFNEREQIKTNRKIDILKAKIVEYEDDNLSQCSSLSLGQNEERIAKWVNDSITSDQKEGNQRCRSVRPKTRTMKSVNVNEMLTEFPERRTLKNYLPPLNPTAPSFTSRNEYITLDEASMGHPGEQNKYNYSKKCINPLLTSTERNPPLPDIRATRPERTYYDSSTTYLATLELKKAPPVPFNGDPFHFRGWMQSLTSKMSTLDLTPLDKIDILEAHTIGAPRDLLQTFKGAYAHDPHYAYHKILDKLKDRFGDNNDIFRELYNKLLKFPRVNGNEDDRTVALNLRKLSDLCQVIDAHMEEISDLQILNYEAGQDTIRAKLPSFMNNRWRDEKGHFIETNHVPPTFRHFCNFLERNADRLCRDLHSKVDLRTDTQTYSKQRFSTLQTSVGEATENYKCQLHRSNTHTIEICALFAGLNHKVKMQLVQNYGLCFRCLGPHMISSCTEDVRCETCRSNEHVTTMHLDRTRNRRRFYETRTREEFPNNSSIRAETRAPNREFEESSLCTSICKAPDGTAVNCSKVFLVDITVPGHNVSFRTYAIIDEQSSNTFVTPQVLDALNIRSPLHDYNLSTLTSHQTRVTGRIAKDLIIKGVTETESYILSKAYENDFIPDTKNEAATPSMLKRHPVISKFADNFAEHDENAFVGVLIGRDTGSLMTTSTIPGTSPVVHCTPLGWAIVGSLCLSNHYTGKKLRTALNSMKTSFNQEHYKANIVFPHHKVFREEKDDDMIGTSVEDRKFLDIVQNNIIVNEDGNIQMPLPLRNEDKPMPDNMKPVFHRQNVTLKKLKQNPGKLKQCLEFMQNIIDSKHVEPVDERNDSCLLGRTWHLPVFPVYHPKKNKVRLVFDSAASYSGVSLNSSLLQGPDNNNKLRGVLLRFREEQVGFIADVASMFHSFHVHDEHRDYMRFFWFSNNDPSKKLVLFRAKVHIFGNTCSPSIATIGLRKAAESILTKSDEDIDEIDRKTLQYIHTNFYVDDGLGCANSWKESVAILTKAKTVLGRFNINLHKIVSNDERVMNSFPELERGEVISVDFDDSCVHRTLGVEWNVKKDMFLMKVDLPDRPFTRRGVLAVINSIYDPIGFASPVVLGGRLIMRRILPRKQDLDKTLSHYGWDDELPVEFLQSWNLWKKTITSLSALSIARCIKPVNFGNIKTSNMHIYCDSSEVAIGHAIYLQVVNDEQDIHVSFIYGECKVSPRSAISIPRLELCAAVEAAKSAYATTRELTNKPDNTYFHTDSRVVLGYITNETKRFSQYVSRRVQTILNVSHSSQWRYISTDQNPADVATRPIVAEDLLASNWFSGPAVLKTNFEFDEETPECSLEILPEEVESSRSLVSTRVEETLGLGFEKIAQTKSNWGKLLRLLKIVLKVCNKWLQKTKSSSPVEIDDEDLTNQAINILIKEVQERCYGDIVKNTREGGTPSHPSSLSHLAPFVDDKGVLRVGGRIKRSDFPSSITHPIILPHENHVTDLIVSHYHESIRHQGRHVTLGAIREAGFFIERSSKKIKNLIKKCVICRKLRGKLEEQYMSDLPKDRLECTPPFLNSGLDVMGPWNIHDGNATRRRTGTKKIWAVLFTCLSSRAVHIEPLPSLDTPSFQNAFRRFIAIRGRCKLIRSDRGTNFVGTSGSIDFMGNSNFLKDNGCVWLFNPPHASHFGGVWERKIGQVKNILNAVIKITNTRTLSRDEMFTFFQEAVSIVNATPLWEISDDPNDPLPLCPATLLNLREPTIGANENFSDKDLMQYGKKRWRRVQYLSHMFWKRWRTNYLDCLQQRQKWLKKTTNIAPGDVVLLKDKNMNRNDWPVGRIQNVKCSDDGLIRSATIKVSKSIGESVKICYYERPICDLVLLVRDASLLDD